MQYRTFMYGAHCFRCAMRWYTVNIKLDEICFWCLWPAQEAIVCVNLDFYSDLIMQMV